MLFKVSSIIENCNSVKNQTENMQFNFHQSEDKLTSENTYIFINDFEETELLKGRLDNNITELLDKTNIIQEYELDVINNDNEFDLLSNDSDSI